MIVVAVLCLGGFAALAGARIAGVRAGRIRAGAPSPGERLRTWLAETGVDVTPAQFLGGSRGTSVAWEQTVTPTLSSFLLTLNLTF